MIFRIDKLTFGTSGIIPEKFKPAFATCFKQYFEILLLGATNTETLYPKSLDSLFFSDTNSEQRST